MHQGFFEGLEFAEVCFLGRFSESPHLVNQVRTGCELVLLSRGVGGEVTWNEVVRGLELI